MPPEDRMAPETRYLYSRITEEPQRLAPIMEETAARFPPGKAIRKYQQGYDSFRRQQEARGGPDPNAKGGRPPLTEDEKIESGQRALARSSLHNLVKSGRVKTERRDGEEWVWLNVCPTCHRPLTGPLPTAQETDPRTEEPKSNVLRPNFPQWEAPATMPARADLTGDGSP